METVDRNNTSYVIGTSAETKPVGLNSGSKFFESDTGIEYIWSGSAWIALNTNIELTKLPGDVDFYFPHEAAYISWILGDSATAVTIALSASSVSAAIDMRKLRRDSGTVQVVLTGNGTGKLTVEGSRDGVNNFHSLGDRITGMVVGTGSYILKLDDSNLAYFPYYRFTVTETGGANNISVKAFLMARGG